MGRLSGSVLASNDIDKVSATMKSASWADEVVVFDALSTDGTRKIAKECSSVVQACIALNAHLKPQRNYFTELYIKYTRWYPNYRQSTLLSNGCMCIIFHLCMMGTY